MYSYFFFISMTQFAYNNKTVKLEEAGIKNALSGTFWILREVSIYFFKKWAE